MCNIVWNPCRRLPAEALLVDRLSPPWYLVFAAQATRILLHPAVPSEFSNVEVLPCIGRWRDSHSAGFVVKMLSVGGVAPGSMPTYIRERFISRHLFHCHTRLAALMLIHMLGRCSWESSVRLSRLRDINILVRIQDYKPIWQSKYVHSIRCPIWL